MHCSLFEFITLVLNIAPDTGEFSKFSDALLVRIAFLLVTLQLLMLFVGTLTYLEPKVFILITFYNLRLLIINYKNINCTQYTFIHISSHRIMIGVKAAIE
jgi:hypothetical protein